MNTTNNPLIFIVRIVTWIIDILAETIVTLFDGLRRTMVHANPSVFSFLATVLPLALPLPVAFMTSNSARHFFGWEPWAANTLGFGLEGLGLLAWVFAVEAYLQKRGLALFGSVAIAYEATLVFLNVALAAQEGVSKSYIVVLLLICFLPALSAIMYGNMRQNAEAELKRQDDERKAEAERVRQERRQDRKDAQALKMQYAKDAPSMKLAEVDRKNGVKFRRS
jgi:hypothetical protein